MKNKEASIPFSKLTSGSYAFMWSVAEGGHKLVDENTYKIVGEKGDIGPWLLPQGETARTYSPLSQPGLHRKFARLSDDDSIIDFADKYGLLGQDKVPLALKTPNPTPLVFGESIERWRRESQDMGVLLAFWDLVKNGGDAGKLGQIVIWGSRGDSVSVRYQGRYDETQRKWQILKKEVGPTPLSDHVLLAKRRPSFMPHLLDRWHIGDLIEPAKFYVCSEVNKRLEGHVSPKILPFLRDRVTIFPHSLLAALWVLFFMELTGSVRLRQCDLPRCGNWKAVKKDRPSFYCSNACRQAAFRKKRRREETKRGQQ